MLMLEIQHGTFFLWRPHSLMSCGLPLVNTQPCFVAGNTMGLACPDGLLIPHVLGLILLFAPQRSIGENVPGLIDHPDWPRVRELMKLLPYQVHVLCTKLETISPTARSRLFFLFSPSSSTPDWASLVLSPKDWSLKLGIYHHFWKNKLFSLRNRKGCCLKGHCSQWHNVWLPTTIASWTVRRLSPNGRQ